MNLEELRKMTLEELGQAARAARQQAKQTRNLWKDRDPSEARDKAFQTAIDDVAVVMNAFKERADQTEKDSLSERDIALEIGDYFGVQGGALRDWGRFQEAAKAYREGHSYEKRVKELGGKSNSYCLVQELVNLILADRAAFVSEEARRNNLSLARDEIRRQVHDDRKGDPWAQADLALVSQLVDEERAVDEWDALDDLHPKRNVYEATRDVVCSLFESLRPHLSDASVKSWEDVIERLK